MPEKPVISKARTSKAKTKRSAVKKTSTSINKEKAKQEIADHEILESLGKDECIAMLRMMLLIRRFEERTAEMYQQRKIGGFCHLYSGQEAIAVGTCFAKRKDDYIVTSYRDHGFALALGMTPNECMAEMFGKVTGCVRGKGGSMHFFSKDKNLLGGHGIVGGQIPIGTGAAFRAKYLGTDQVSLTFFGEGAMAQGTFHESINLSSIWHLPCIYVIENNRYGMGTEVSRVASIEDLYKRADSYSIDGLPMNGLNVFQCYQTMKEVISKCRETSRPTLIEAKTYRYRGHSVSDPAKYRPKIELEAYKLADPISGARLSLEQIGWLDEEGYKKMDHEVKAIVIQSIKFSEESPDPGLEELMQYVYCD